ncbi:MAG: hypothetical protein ACUVQ8_07970 [Nitrososphaeria archaeon]
MKNHFRLYSISRRRNRGPDILLYCLPMLSKEQFSDLVFILVNHGFRLSRLAIRSRLKLAKDEARKWLSQDLSGYPPYYAILYSNSRSSYTKVYSGGVLLSNSPIEQLIVDFMKKVHSYKRIRRPIPSNIFGAHFENTYFALSYSNDTVRVLLKSRFESLKSYWLANRRANCLYLVDDELIVLKALCRMIAPKSVECYFSLPLSDKYTFTPVLRPGVRPLFKGRVNVRDFMDQIDVLISRSFPRQLKGLKSFILPESSRLDFYEPRSRLNVEGVKSLFEELREYCFDSFHLTDSFYAMA